MARPLLPTAEAERQFEIVAKVYYRQQLMGELPKKPKMKGFRLEAYAKEMLGLDQLSITRIRARARNYIEKLRHQKNKGELVG